MEECCIWDREHINEVMKWGNNYHALYSHTPKEKTQKEQGCVSCICQSNSLKQFQDKIVTKFSLN